MKKLSDSKEFWKTMKTFLPDKNTSFSQVSIEKKKTVYDDLFNEFSTFIEDILSLLNVKPLDYTDDTSDGTENFSEPVEIAIKKFENHPSVQGIK